MLAVKNGTFEGHYGRATTAIAVVRNAVMKRASSGLDIAAPHEALSLNM